MRTLRTLLLVVVAACATSSSDDTDPETSSASQGLSGADGNAYVNYHRERLLEGYAQDHGLGSATNAWNTLSYEQRLLFLIHTDLLGNRSFITPTWDSYYRSSTDSCGNANEQCGTCSIFGGQRACGSCAIETGGYGCESVSAYDCYVQGQCWEQPGSRTDWSMALEHVTRLYEVLDGFGSCSGSDGNRTFFSADSLLINAFRNRYMPEWVGNSDIGSVHAPFNNRSETNTGRPFSCDGPDGQVQFFSYDWQGQAFTRGGKYFPADGLMFELDDDYNTTHDSNPTCSYCGGQYGLSMYESHWRYKGNAAPFNWAWAPPAPQPPQITSEQLYTAPYTPNAVNAGELIRLTGYNFCSNPTITIGGVTSYASLSGANEITGNIATTTPGGGQYLYVNCSGVQSNPYYVTVSSLLTCALSGPSVVYAGNSASWSGTTSQPGYYAYWYGSKDGQGDVWGAFAGVTPFGLDAYYDANSRGSYSRYLVIKDASNNVRCVTNTIYTSVY
ncbi:MAG: hypothetical protein ABI678_00155 [Kofleriaceae bacterium]